MPLSRDAVPLPDDAEKEVVLTKAVIRAADRLGVRGATLGGIIGVSQATISRMRNGPHTLSRNDKAFELAALFVRLFRSLDAIVGGDEAAARSWLNSPNTALGARPIDLIQSITGLTRVLMYVDSRRAKV